MRLLIAASGGEGHLGPLMPFASAAFDAGDDVMAVVPPAQEETVRAAGIAYSLTNVPPADEVRRVRRAMASDNRAVRSHAAEVELFGRVNTIAALPVSMTAMSAFRPHLVLREPCDYASAIAATRHRIPMAQVGISPGMADISGLRQARHVIEPHARGVAAAVESAPYLTRFPNDDDTGFPDVRRYGFGGPVEPRHGEFPPLVWLTMGTVNTGFEQIRGTWAAAVEALSTLPVRVLASTGRGGTPIPPSSNVEIVEWVELSEILSRASMVVCHGGSGTTLAALAAGLPVVSIPMLADQPTNAAMVEHLGAGISVAPAIGDTIRGLSSTDVPRLRDAMARVLKDSSYRTAAQHVAAHYSTALSVQDQLDRLRDSAVRVSTQRQGSDGDPVLYERNSTAPPFE